jgi:hypothetical protein
MKKQYERLEMDFIAVQTDVVTASSVVYDTDNVGGWQWGVLQ